MTFKNSIVLSLTWYAAAATDFPIKRHDLGHGDVGVRRVRKETLEVLKEISIGATGEVSVKSSHEPVRRTMTHRAVGKPQMDERKGGEHRTNNCDDIVNEAFHNVLCRHPAASECSQYNASLDLTDLEDQLRLLGGFVISSCTEGIPACDGCGNREGECWTTCDRKAGMCSKCDSVTNGKQGACCKHNFGPDPPECKVVPGSYFKHVADYHECVIQDVEFPVCKIGTSECGGTNSVGECWNMCHGQDANFTGGYCDGCNSQSGSLGVCCDKDAAPGDTHNPLECQRVARDDFLWGTGGHECVIAETPKCTGCGANIGECWTTCNQSTGPCTMCDSEAGTLGACCHHDQRVTDHPWCQQHVNPNAFRYKTAGYAQCVLMSDYTTSAPTPSPTVSPTTTPTITASDDTDEGCPFEHLTTVDFDAVTNQPIWNGTCSGFDMTGVGTGLAPKQEACWQNCLNNVQAPGCTHDYTAAPCVAAMYTVQSSICHLASSCETLIYRVGGWVRRADPTSAPTAIPPTPFPTTKAPTPEPQRSVSVSIQVNTASTAKPKSLTVSGNVTSDAYCVAWYKAEPEPLWYGELFPDRPTGEVKFGDLNGGNAAAILMSPIGEVKHYGVLDFWHWNTLDAICRDSLRSPEVGVVPGGVPGR